MQLDARYPFAKNCCQHQNGDKAETEKVQGKARGEVFLLCIFQSIILYPFMLIGLQSCRWNSVRTPFGTFYQINYCPRQVISLSDLAAERVSEAF